MDFIAANLDIIMTGKVPTQRKLAKDLKASVPAEGIWKTFASHMDADQWEIRNFLAILMAEVARENTAGVEKALHRLAADGDWRVREAAASVLVEVSHKNIDWVLETAARLRQQEDPNQVRTGLEGLRDIARKKPELVITAVEPFLNHKSKYVRDAAANLLRNGSRKYPDFIRQTIAQWQEQYRDDLVAQRTLKEGSQKL